MYTKKRLRRMSPQRRKLARTYNDIERGLRALKRHIDDDSIWQIEADAAMWQEEQRLAALPQADGADEPLVFPLYMGTQVNEHEEY